MSEKNNSSSFSPPASEELNEWFSGYEILDLLACGGMGAVYLGRQISLDRLVAIKILPSELAVDETFRKSFEAEGKAMAKLSHSNLVGVYDFGEISNMLFLVIEYVDGSNLFQSKGDSAIDPETAVTLIRSVCSGLAEAHHIGLVHRDIKPANILIGRDLVPKLGDFGLAVPDSDIESGLMMGTPAYLAPEVMKDPTSASAASDTFALGVILYEMLTGDSIEKGDVMDLSKVPALGDLPKIVRKAVGPKPLLRYQTGEDLEKALNDWILKPKSSGLVMNSTGSTVTPNITADAYDGSSGRGGMLWGLLALLITGGLAWALWGVGTSGGETPDEVAIAPLISDSPSPSSSPDLSRPKGISSPKELKSAEEKRLLEMSGRIAEAYAKNREDFLKAAGEEGKVFLEALPNDLVGLPRYLHKDEMDLSAELLRHLQEYVDSRQAGLDRKFQSEVLSMHRKSIRELSAAKVEIPVGVKRSWEEWIEWLGRNPVAIMHSQEAGQWKFRGIPEGFELHISATGKQIILIGEKKIEGQELLVVGANREVTLHDAADTVYNYPWTLEWKGDELVGNDSNGRVRRLTRLRFDFANRLKDVQVPPRIESEKPEADKPMVDAPEPSYEKFGDSEVAALTDSYRGALILKIEPLETGYLKVLEGFANSYRAESEEISLEQVESEIVRLKSMNWREGFTQSSVFSDPGELPKEVAAKSALFKKEFRRRYEPLHRTYRQSLQKMLRERKGRGDENLADIQSAIEKTESVKGAVRARFVKIESLPDDGIRNATISVFDILDLTGKKIPNRNFTNVEVSSFQPESEEGSTPVPERAIDGDPSTRWTTKWKNGGSKFPHWLSFDLGGEYWITGFQITSRGSRFWNRETDIINWRFYVSADGKKWTEVAKGKFPKGHQLNEHIGFEVVE